MSIKNIRSFIEARLKEVDSDYTEHSDAFNVDNIGELNLDKAFHVFYADMSNVSVDQATSTDEVNVTVSLLTKTDRYAQEFLDEAFDKAIKFKMYCINPTKIVGQTFIKKVRFSSMRAEPLDGNDNASIIKVNLRFTVMYGLAIDLSCDC